MIDELWPESRTRGDSHWPQFLLMLASSKLLLVHLVFNVLCDKVDRTGFLQAVLHELPCLRSSFIIACDAPILFQHTPCMYRHRLCRHLFRRSVSWSLRLLSRQDERTMKSLHDCVCCVMEPKRYVNCVQHCCENETLVNNMSILSNSVHVFDVMNGFIKVGSIKKTKQDQLCGFWKRVSCRSSSLY